MNDFPFIFNCNSYFLFRKDSVSSVVTPISRTIKCSGWRLAECYLMELPFNNEPPSDTTPQPHNNLQSFPTQVLPGLPNDQCQIPHGVTLLFSSCLFFGSSWLFPCTSVLSHSLISVSGCSSHPAYLSNLVK